MVGTTVSHYRILELLGSGGMGEVYRAEDTALGRSVALKFLPESVAQDKDRRERFIREARAASALNHPNIVTVYEIGREGENYFIAMEYVPGATLGKLIAARKLDWQECLKIARQVADAMAAAHEHGIVHRDLKPDNIIVMPDGRAKVLDFGVAKLMEGGSGPAATTTATGIVGTLAYMSPEQALGQPADQRSDIFSFGSVLYHALTGRTPFAGKSAVEVHRALLEKNPEPVSGASPGVPQEICRVVERSLEKEPSRRYAHFGDVRADLDAIDRYPEVSRSAEKKSLRWGAAAVLGITLVAATAWIPAVRDRLPWARPALAGPKNLAVLPFEAIGGGPEDQAYSNGITETLTAKLTQLTATHQLQIAPTREVRARGVMTARTTRKELGASLVVEGTVHRSGNTVRVNCALVDTATLRQLRAETITADASDPFAVQDRVVVAIVQMLALELRPQERQMLRGSGTHVAGAQEYYLQGRGYLLNYDKIENIENAIRVFTRALSLDPNYALAHAGLGEAYWKMYEARRESRWVEQVRQACERARQLNPALAQVHVCLGTIANNTGHPERAVAEFEQAIKLEPTNDDAYRALGAAYQNLGKPAEADRTYRQAIELRPHYWAGYSWLGAFYYHQARYKEAEEMFRQVVALVPDSFRGYYNLGAVHVEQGRYAEAIEVLERSLAIRPTATAYSNLGNAYFYSRRFQEAARAFEQAVKLDEQDYLFWWNLGDAYYWARESRTQAARAYRQAISLAEARLHVNPRDTSALSVLAVCHAMLGERKMALQYLQRGLRVAPDDPELRFKAAVVYNQFGEIKPALGWLEKAMAAGWSPTKLRDTPDFDHLRSHPRFQELLQGKMT